MIRLENLEALEPPELRMEAQDDLERLAAELGTRGFDVTVAGLDESVLGHLQESAEHAFVEALNVVLDKTVDAAATLAIEEGLRRWGRRRRRFRDRDGAKATAYIWGPDGEILSVVELAEPDSKE